MMMFRVLAVVVTLLLALTTPASATSPAALLNPGGPYPIGLRTLHLTDADRADHWVPDQRRELMVSLWYPAFPVGSAAEYMTAAESAATVKGLGLSLPSDTLQRVGVHSRKDALTGWKERRHLPETGHSSSIDTGYLAVVMGLKDKLPPAAWERLYGSGDVAENLRFFRDYLVRFFSAIR